MQTAWITRKTSRTAASSTSKWRTAILMFENLSFLIFKYGASLEVQWKLSHVSDCSPHLKLNGAGPCKARAATATSRYGHEPLVIWRQLAEPRQCRFVWPPHRLAPPDGSVAIQSASECNGIPSVGVLDTALCSRQAFSVQAFP